MLNDAKLDAELEEALSLIQCGVEDGIDNQDSAMMHREIKLGQAAILEVIKKAEALINKQ